VRRFRPRLAGLAVEPEKIPDDVKFCQWVFGEKALIEAAELPGADDVLVAVVGFAGLSSVLAALSAGKRVLLANKEALVAGGALVMAEANKRKNALLPVDSEHSAIFQCLRAAEGNAPARLVLTASGGPFRTWDREAIERATVDQALRHPNWSMGPKITVDSATMLNKALEVIEARWLFDLPPERIDVLIHPQSIVHSMVEFQDGALLAQLGTPDMRLPILYAMAYPERLSAGGERLSLSHLKELTFEPVDAAKFPGLSLAYEALRAGGTAPAMLNAANESAVQAFLTGKIPFGRIFRTVRDVLDKAPVRPAASLDAVREADETARRMAASLLSYTEIPAL
jgi:1-deoxy-D-xylulose-5-phosphate reductoisomerase